MVVLHYDKRRIIRIPLFLRNILIQKEVSPNFPKIDYLKIASGWYV